MLIILVNYQALLIGIGLWAKRRSETHDDFLIGVRRIAVLSPVSRMPPVRLPQGQYSGSLGLLSRLVSLRFGSCPEQLKVKMYDPCILENTERIN